jgi:hypothetical protein
MVPRIQVQGGGNICAMTVLIAAEWQPGHRQYCGNIHLSFIRFGSLNLEILFHSPLTYLRGSWQVTRADPWNIYAIDQVLPSDVLLVLDDHLLNALTRIYDIQAGDLVFRASVLDMCICAGQHEE